MKNIRPKHNGCKSWMTIIALLFVATGLLIIPGCQNPFVPQEDSDGQGVLSLAIGEQSSARMITPGLPTNIRYELVFTPRGGNSNQAFTVYNWKSDETIVIDSGYWYLAVNAFRTDVEDPTDFDTHLKFATTVPRLSIEIIPGQTTLANVTLKAITVDNEGRPLYGTFTWHITVPSGFVASDARVDITSLDNSNFDPDGDNYPYTFTAGTLTSLNLPAGRYRVIFRLDSSDTNRESVVISEVLHVYANLTSHFGTTLEDAHFPASLLNIILGEINADGDILENFENADNGEIRAGHFGLLGIRGIDADYFVRIANSFTALRLQPLAPPVLTGIDCLRVLADAALISVRANDSIQANRSTARDFIRDLVANETAVEIPEDSMWTNTGVPVRTGVTVRVGPYEVPITFGGEVYDFTVTFNANGGTGATLPDLRVYNGQVVPLFTGAGNRPGYNFIGWNTHASGGGRLHLGGSPFTVTSSVTLYAAWSWIPPVAPPALFLVTLNSGAGEGNPLELGPVPAGTEIILPALPETFTHENHNFSGWSDDGVRLLPAGAPFIVTGATTLTAQWAGAIPEHVYHTVTLNPNSGVEAPIIMQALYGSAITLPVSGFTRDGLWILAGWARTPTAADGYALGQSFTVHADTVLYAMWEEVTDPSLLDITFVSIANRIEGTLVVSPAIIGDVIQLGMTEAGGVPTSRTFTITGINPDNGTFYWFTGGAQVTGNTSNSIVLSILNGRLISGGLNIPIEPGVRSLNVEVFIGGVPYNLQVPFTVVP